MPHLVIVSAAESSQRRLLSEAVSDCRSRGYEVREGQVWSNWSELLSDSMSTGLFSSKIARIVEDPASLGAFPQPYVGSLDGPDSDVRLILVYGGNHKKFLCKEVVASSTLMEGETIPFWPSKRISWLMGKASSCGIDLSYDGASTMVEWIEDGEELLSVLNTLGRIADGAPVDLPMVKDMVLNQQGRAMLTLLDGFCSRRAGMCIQSLRELGDTGELIPVLSALHKRIRFSFFLRKYGKDNGVEKAMGMTPYQARQAWEGAGLYELSELCDLMAGVICLSMAERSGAGEGWIGLERLLLPRL